jgi:hypothetical protein
MNSLFGGTTLRSGGFGPKNTSGVNPFMTTNANLSSGKIFLTDGLFGTPDRNAKEKEI